MSSEESAQAFDLFANDEVDDSVEKRVERLENLLLDHRSGVHREAGLAQLKKISRLQELVEKAEAEHAKYLKGATKSIQVEKLKFNHAVEKCNATELSFK